MGGGPRKGPKLQTEVTPNTGRRMRLEISIEGDWECTSLSTSGLRSGNLKRVRYLPL